MTPDYTQLADEQAESAIFKRLNDYDEEERLRYAQIGLMVQDVNKRLLWRHRIDIADGMPCRSLARWIRIACPYSYSTVYAAMRDVSELSDVPAADLAQIPQSSFATMKQLSTKVRGDLKVLDIAKHGRTEQLVDYIREHHADQHIESRRILKFTPDESAAAKTLGSKVEIHLEGVLEWIHTSVRKR